MLLYKPLCRPDGAVFCVACLLVGVSPPWGWECISHVDTSERRHLDTFYIRTLPHTIRRTADHTLTLAFHVRTSTPDPFAHSHTPSAVRRTTLAHLHSTSTRRHVDTSAHSALAPEHPNLRSSSLT